MPPTIRVYRPSAFRLPERVRREADRFDRDFSMWVFTVSHGQLLFRARAADGQPRIDVLVKPVEAMKHRADYEGLVIQCGTVVERDRVLASTGQTLRVLVIETAAEFDYVVTGAVGRRADDGRE